MATFITIPELQNFDDSFVYDRCHNAIMLADTRNFVIEFDSTNARAAINLGDDAIQRLLQTQVSTFTLSIFMRLEDPSVSERIQADWANVQRDQKTTTRWINIWAPEKQKATIKRLAAIYKFSPRLTGIMMSEHNTPLPVPQKPLTSPLRAAYNRMQNQFMDRGSIDTTHSSDPERDEKATYLPVHSQMRDLNHYRVVDQVWHYCSVDWGSRYLCIGYNSLSDTDVAPDDGSNGTQDTSERDDDVDHIPASARSDNKPKGARTWSWLILCDDGTVISLYENPFPGQQGNLDDQAKTRLKLIRRNLYNVFKQLSKVNDTHRRENPIHTLDIRPGLGSNQTGNISIIDSSSLLFYYLFDDWYTSYALVAKEEHAYAELLENLRKDMFQKPHLELIQLLHQYGRQLSVLKRMYQSYELIIQRILDKQKSPLPSSGTPSDATTFGAPLSPAATVRFERLQDRITHYAISEIQECLDEKEALVFLNFNLITLKESQAVERLTRITILLAKVTILFMPVSLMTGYFSTQLINIANSYTITTYWISFAVIMALSFIFLMIFGALSNTLEGKPIYRTLTQTVVEAGKGRWRARMDRGRKVQGK